MATGQPRKLRQICPDGQEITPVELTYRGKRSAADILNVRAGKFEIVVDGSEEKRLYFSDNIDALATLARDPRVRGKVRLVYIDPPYATQTVFHSRQLTHAFEDVFDTAEYLNFLRERLVFLHHLLADDGSIYLHIDDKMLFHTKLLLDEIFGPLNFRNCITRRKCNPKNYTRRTYGNIADYILFYTKTRDYIWNRQVEAWTPSNSKEYQYVEAGTGRKFMKVPIHAPGVRNGETGRAWRGMLPPRGKHWQFPPSTLDELDVKGEIFWSKNNNPRRKVYQDTSNGVTVQDIWIDFRDAHNQNVHITGYPTEKNLALLKRIIAASSNPGDIVLDCFAGSGTTAVAAHELERKWILMDNSTEALRTMLHRFSKGTEIMGDFVTSRDARADESPSLFDALGEDSIPSAKLQSRVDGFSVLAAPDMIAAVQRILMS